MGGDAADNDNDDGNCGYCVCVCEGECMHSHVNQNSLPKYTYGPVQSDVTMWVFQANWFSGGIYPPHLQPSGSGYS